MSFRLFFPPGRADSDWIDSWLGARHSRAGVTPPEVALLLLSMSATRVARSQQRNLSSSNRDML